MPSRRTALLLPALALALTGCLSQPEEANDNPSQEEPTRPPSVFSEPSAVPTAPLTVDQPEGVQATPSG